MHLDRSIASLVDWDMYSDRNALVCHSLVMTSLVDWDMYSDRNQCQRSIERHQSLVDWDMYSLHKSKKIAKTFQKYTPLPLLI